MVDDHTKKELELNKQIATLKESYRICLTKYEKEKDTKDTLQECVKALQDREGVKEVESLINENDQNKVQPENTNTGKQHGQVKRKENTTTTTPCRFFNKKRGCRYKDKCRFLHVARSKAIDENNEQSFKEAGGIAPQPCFFFNKRNGCRNGEKCRYAHIKQPKCQKPSCDSKQCSLDHKTDSKTNNNRSTKDIKTTCRFFNTNNGCRNGTNCRFLHTTTQTKQVSTDNFLPISTENKPPDIQYTMKDIQAMVQQQIHQLVGSKLSVKEQPVPTQQNYPPTYLYTKINQNTADQTQYHQQTVPLYNYPQTNGPANAYVQPTNQQLNYHLPTQNNYLAQLQQQIPIYSH